MATKRNLYPAQAFFFPAATVHALIVIPLSVLANTGLINSVGLVASGHALEMLGGFALALVAGYTLGPIALPRGLFLLFIWLAGRIFALTAWSSLFASLLTLLFGLLVALEVLPRYKVAKRWRNLAQLPLLGAVTLLPGFWSLAREMPLSAFDLNVMAETAGILFLTLLMLFMAGRLIAPAAAGAFYDTGSNLKDRVQPNIEGALLILIPLAISLFWLRLTLLAGLTLVSAGILAMIRLYRWRLWNCRNRTDLYGLGAGYAWLAVGLIFVGVSMVIERYQPAWLHIITIGALGTLSTGIMSRWYFYYFRRTLPARLYLRITVTMVAVAALSRWVAILLPEYHHHLLWCSVAAWELAYMAALWLAVDGFLRRKDRPEREPRPLRPHALAGKDMT